MAWGRDFGGAFTVGALCALKAPTAYETYFNVPLPVQIDRAGLPLLSNLISGDLTDDEDPVIVEKIAEIHRNRFRKAFRRRRPSREPRLLRSRTHDLSLVVFASANN